MKKFSFLGLLIFVSVILLNCNRDEIIDPNPPVTPAVTNGLFFLCEGSMTPGTSNLSFYNFEKDSLYSDIFSPSRLGLFPDGIIKVGNYLYITEQGNFNSTGKVYQCDTNGTVLNVGNAGINPYSLCFSNNKLFITNGPSGSVSVVDSKSLNLIKNIQVGVYPQEIISFKNKIFVCNMSVYGGAADSTVSVIDALVDSVVFTIKLRKDPSSIALSNNNELIVGCQGNNGSLYTINPDNYSVANSYQNIDFGKEISVDKYSDNIYFISNSNSIINFNLQGVSVVYIENTNPTANYFYGYTYDSKNKRHFIANARNFIVSGEIRRYNFAGILEKSIPVGIAPRRLLINN